MQQLRHASPPPPPPRNILTITYFDTASEATFGTKQPPEQAFHCSSCRFTARQEHTSQARLYWSLHSTGSYIGVHWTNANLIDASQWLNPCCKWKGSYAWIYTSSQEQIRGRGRAESIDWCQPMAKSLALFTECMQEHHVLFTMYINSWIFTQEKCFSSLKVAWVF